jgi:putative polyhydroxyalkanoate system protein
MPDIDVTRIHDLGLAGARARAERMADQLGRKFDLKGAWEGDVLKFERPGVSGSLAVTDHDLRLLVSLGFLLKAMKGSIEKAVVHELDTLFANAKGAAPGEAQKTSKPAAPTAKMGPASPKKGG